MRDFGPSIGTERASVERVGCSKRREAGVGQLGRKARVSHERFDFLPGINGRRRCAADGTLVTAINKALVVALSLVVVGLNFRQAKAAWPGLAGTGVWALTAVAIVSRANSLSSRGHPAPGSACCGSKMDTVQIERPEPIKTSVKRQPGSEFARCVRSYAAWADPRHPHLRALAPVTEKSPIVDMYSVGLPSVSLTPARRRSPSASVVSPTSLPSKYIDQLPAVVEPREVGASATIFVLAAAPGTEKPQVEISTRPFETAHGIDILVGRRHPDVAAVEIHRPRPGSRRSAGSSARIAIDLVQLL